MAKFIECDGCGVRISKAMQQEGGLRGVYPLGITGQIAHSRRSSFHWCSGCADTALQAVRDAQGAGRLAR